MSEKRVGGVGMPPVPVPVPVLVPPKAMGEKGEEAPPPCCTMGREAKEDMSGRTSGSTCSMEATRA